MIGYALISNSSKEWHFVLCVISLSYLHCRLYSITVDALIVTVAPPLPTSIAAPRRNLTGAINLRLDRQTDRQNTFIPSKPTLVYCWASVVDVGPLVIKRWANVSCFLGYTKLNAWRTTLRLRMTAIAKATQKLLQLFIQPHTLPTSKRSERETPIQCWADASPASTTSDQQQANRSRMFRAR